MDKDYVILSVRDNDVGIDSEKQQVILEKFQHIRTNTEGLGVGLYLVNTIATSAGGRTEIEIEPEKGSIISIFLKEEHPDG